MKNLIIALIILGCLLTSICIPVSAASIINEGTCGENLTWILDSEGTLTISGNGAMENYKSYKNVPWYDLREQVKLVDIKQNVTTIGNIAFYNCYNLTNITLPEGLTSIGASAFYECVNLTDISLPDTLTNIGDAAFCSCHALKNVNIPNNITVIGFRVFDFCENLTTVTVPAKVTSINGSAFYNCRNLESIAIPKSVATIAKNAFNNCVKLKTVYYSGSESEWKNIQIASQNDPLLKATIVFNSPENTKNNENTDAVPENTVKTSFGATVSTWAVSEIESAYKNNLIPESIQIADLTKKVNRGEFAAIAVQLYETLSKKQADEPTICKFIDIENDVNKNAIKKAYALEIAQGTSEKTYEPLNFINREQLATMLCRVVKKYSFPDWTMATDNEYYMQTDGVKLFKDDSDISIWAKPSVYFMAKYGIIKGVSETHFAPKNTTTQQEASGYASATREQALILAQRIFTHSDLFEF